MMLKALVLISLVLLPVTSNAADLVFWWESGHNAEEDRAVRELVTAFEQNSGNRVELTFYQIAEQAKAVRAAIDAEAPPDFLFGIRLQPRIEQWAFEGRFVDLIDAVQPLGDLFDANLLNPSTLLNGRTAERRLYALPMGRSSLHLHVWTGLLEQDGFEFGDVPKQWGPFWAFWCDRVQPALRGAMGRDDVWATGLPMSADPTSEARFVFLEFIHALGANYVTPEGSLLLDDPRVRAGLMAALESYTAIWRKGHPARGAQLGSG